MISNFYQSPKNTLKKNVTFARAAGNKIKTEKSCRSNYKGSPKCFDFLFGFSFSQPHKGVSIEIAGVYGSQVGCLASPFGLSSLPMIKTK